MKLFSISRVAWVIIFIVGCLFIWFRKADATGTANGLINQLISLGIWLFMFTFILIGHLIWHHYLAKK